MDWSITSLVDGEPLEELLDVIFCAWVGKSSDAHYTRTFYEDLIEIKRAFSVNGIFVIRSFFRKLRHLCSRELILRGLKDLYESTFDAVKVIAYRFLLVEVTGHSHVCLAGELAFAVVEEGDIIFKDADVSEEIVDFLFLCCVWKTSHAYEMLLREVAEWLRWTTSHVRVLRFLFTLCDVSSSIVEVILHDLVLRIDQSLGGRGR